MCIHARTKKFSSVATGLHFFEVKVLRCCFQALSYEQHRKELEGSRCESYIRAKIEVGPIYRPTSFRGRVEKGPEGSRGPGSLLLHCENLMAEHFPSSVTAMYYRIPTLLAYFYFCGGNAHMPNAILNSAS